MVKIGVNLFIMYYMEVKFGKIRPNNNIFIASALSSFDGNFFASDSNSDKENKKNENPYAGSGSRINDYDGNILGDNAYKDLPDEMFKLEHKIGILEEALSKVTNEIETLESFGYTIQLTALKDRRKKIENELQELNQHYSQMGISAKISSQIASAVSFTSKRKSGIFSHLKLLFSTKLLSRLSKKLNCRQAMKEALESLFNINSSVDELIKIQVPYGETITRYEKLTAYLNKANTIHAQISRNVNMITKNSDKK